VKLVEQLAQQATQDSSGLDNRNLPSSRNREDQTMKIGACPCHVAGAVAPESICLVLTVFLRPTPVPNDDVSKDKSQLNLGV
jgi:hypothetical protein